MVPLFGIFFDCDGVLVDSEETKYFAWRDALAQEGIAFAPDEYAALVGQPTYVILQSIAQKTQKDLPSTIVDRFKEQYHAKQEKEIPLIPAAIHFAQILANKKREKRFALGLVSGGSHREIDNNLRHAGLTGIFDILVSGEDDLQHIKDPEGYNKPKPYIYLYAAERVGLSPTRCMVLEDTEAGVVAAKRAGMHCIAVPHAFTQKQDFSAADRVVSSLSELSFSEIKSFFCKGNVAQKGKEG